MSPIKIQIAARIDETIAKGIAPGARMTARMLGSKIDDDDGCYYTFTGGQLLIRSDEFSSYVSIHFATRKVFEQDTYGNVELFIPGDDWEEGLHYLLGVAVQDHRAQAKKESEDAVKKSIESDQRAAAHWKM